MSTPQARSLKNPSRAFHGTIEKKEDMNMYGSSNTNKKDDKGFTLIEILIAIVLIGILSAVAVVGISSLVSKGTDSACNASLDASNAATAVYFAANDNTYPLNFTELQATTNGGAALTLPSSVKVNTEASATPAVPAGIAKGLQASSGTSWYLTMTPGTDGGAPTFACTTP